MRLTEIDANNITKEMIKNILFNVPNESYLDADCMIIFGCHIKEITDEKRTENYSRYSGRSGTDLRGTGPSSPPEQLRS